MLVSRTLRFHKGEPSPEMRDAGVAALNEAMEKADDIRNHAALLPLVPHARALTEDLPDTPAATLLSWLGNFNRARGAYVNAANDFRRTLDIRKHLLGTEDHGTLASMNNLTAMLLHLSDAQGARALVAEALPVALRKYGCAPELSRALIALAEQLGVPVP